MLSKRRVAVTWILRSKGDTRSMGVGVFCSVTLFREKCFDGMCYLHLQGHNYALRSGLWESK